MRDRFYTLVLEPLDELRSALEQIESVLGDLRKRAEVVGNRKR
jgi:hypothetical protein